MDYVEGRGTKGNERDVVVAVMLAPNGYRVFAPPEYMRELEDILENPVLVGGTYEAPDGTLLKAYYAVDGFFRGKWESKVKGELEPIPYEPGVVY